MRGNFVIRETLINFGSLRETRKGEAEKSLIIIVSKSLSWGLSPTLIIIHYQSIFIY
jgi:hypothetical protein